MPTKEKTYKRVVFKPEVIKEVTETIEKILPPQKRKLTYSMFSITISEEEKWVYDNEEEFFADYRKGFQYASFRKEFHQNAGQIKLWASQRHTDVSICMEQRADVEKVFNVLEAHVDECRLPEPPPEVQVKPMVRIFIGHGRNPQWRDLKDHLHEKHGLDVETYEVGARAGLPIRDVLDDMLTRSSFAILLLTGEDLDAEGHLHPRENVIHELGLFQGRLGWRKAIALLEEGVEEFSNIHGLNQIRFAKGNIRETFGEVLATIRREFEGEEWA